MNVFIITCCVLAGIILILFFVLFLLKFKITVKVENNIVKVYLWNIRFFNSAKNTKIKNNKNIDKEIEFENKYKWVKNIINFLRCILDDKKDDLVLIIRYIKRAFIIKRFDFSLDYGFGDAALTGITGGIIWGLISNISAFIGKFINLNSFTNIAVKPHYTEKFFDYKVEFVFYVSLINLLKTYRHVKRFKKTLEGRD